MCYFRLVLKKSNTWFYLIQLHKITPQVYQMLKQPSYASMNYFVQTYKHYNVGVQATFQVENDWFCCLWSQSLLWIILSVMGQHTLSLKCLSLLLVFHGKIISLFCLMWFNAFSLFPFNWSHLESLEMMSEALSHMPEMSALSCLYFVLDITFLLELTVLKAFFIFTWFFDCALFFSLPQSHFK